MPLRFCSYCAKHKEDSPDVFYGRRMCWDCRHKKNALRKEHGLKLPRRLFYNQEKYHALMGKPEVYKKLASSSRLHRYGLTQREYGQLLDKQEGKCALCGKEEGTKLHIDHCHETNKVRGLLCNPCNQGLGCLGDTIEGLEKAIEYLRNYQNIHC